MGVAGHRFEENCLIEKRNHFLAECIVMAFRCKAEGWDSASLLGRVVSPERATGVSCEDADSYECDSWRADWSVFMCQAWYHNHTICSWYRGSWLLVNPWAVIREKRISNAKCLISFLGGNMLGSEHARRGPEPLQRCRQGALLTRCGVPVLDSRIVSIVLYEMRYMSDPNLILKVISSIEASSCGPSAMGASLSMALLRWACLRLIFTKALTWIRSMFEQITLSKCFWYFFCCRTIWMPAMSTKWLTYNLQRGWYNLRYFSSIPS